MWDGTSLLPREHGAYGQMAFPLVTSFAVAGVTTPALFIGIGVVAAFVAHEPLLVLLGRRGIRERREQGRRAAVWLAAAGATAVVAGVAALGSAPPGVGWSFLLPVVPAAFLAAAISAKREKSWQGEVAAAVAFSLVAVPTCVSAGARTSTALAVGIVFAVIFVAGTLAVRVIVLNVRRGGDPRAVRASRMAVLLLTAGASLGLAAAAVRTALPWIPLMAAAPGLAAASWVAMFPASPARLRPLGWMLVATSAAAAVILIGGLRAAAVSTSTSQEDIMAPTPAVIPAAEALRLESLITPTAHGISSRALARTAGGNLTLFAFDAGQELSEHATPFDAFVMVLDGAVALTIGGTLVRATPGTIVRMPANVPHAVHAPEAARMLLIMLRDRSEA